MAKEPDSLVPSAEESIRILQDLLSMWHAHDGTVALPLIDGTPLPGMAIHVQVEHAVELTESVIILIRNHRYLPAAPLIRLTMECAVTAAWWATNPVGVRGSVHESARLRTLRIRGMHGGSPASYTDTPEMRAAMSEYARFTSGEAKAFEQRCKALVGGEWIYPYYRLLSEASHGGTSLLDEYSEQVPVSANAPEGIALLQHPHYQTLEIALGLQVIMLTLAIAAWDAVSPAHPDQDALHEMADRLGFGEFIPGATGRKRG